MQRSTRRVLVATADAVFYLGDAGRLIAARGIEGESVSAITVRSGSELAWCGTSRGVFRSNDAGATWTSSDLTGHDVTALTTSPAEPHVVWAGTEPSQVWRSPDNGAHWVRAEGLDKVPSAPSWSFPPKPDTHHVRWLKSDPTRAGHLYVAIEAGALIRTTDGGRTWQDRVPTGPFDTHELAIHPRAPDVLRSAAGDGYFESHDGGATWASPDSGLDVNYMRSIAIDPERPDVVLIAGATGPFSAYAAGRSDGRVYRREGDGRWARVKTHWPGNTLAPILRAGTVAGEFWATDERGIHRSTDAGVTWKNVATFSSVQTPWDLAVTA